MSMSKKDFIALADAVREVVTGPQAAEVYRVDIMQARVIDALCRFQRGQNSAFNESRWRSYLMGECGPSGGKVKPSKEWSDEALQKMRGLGLLTAAAESKGGK